MSTAAVPAPAGWRVWWLAVRPRTFGASLAPVFVGWGLAAGIGRFAVGPAVAALAGALLLQIGANLVNDYVDGVRGTDDAGRVGPTRVTQAGLLPPGRVRLGAVVAFAGATAAGLALTVAGGWPVAALGLFALVLSVVYTAGPWPLSHHGLGEAAAFLACGPIAVGGTLFAQAHSVAPGALGLSCGTGLLAAALMGVNNLRDRHSDGACGKRTLAVRFGERAGRGLVVALGALAFALPPALALAGLVPWRACTVLGALPLAIVPWRLALTADGAVLNGALAGTGRVMLVYGLLLAAGLAW